MVIQPKIRGFICTTSHPVGCAQHVQEQIDFVAAHAPFQGPKKVLIIGASTGYGLASRIVSAFGAGAQTIGVFFEKPSNGKRTASAGWYNSAAFEKAASKAGIYAKSINGDAFSDAIKQQTVELIQKDWGGEVDLVIYSLASPKRVHPKTGEVFSSTLKPIGQAFSNKTLDVMAETVSTVTLEPASEEEIKHTIEVMGGDDWALWIDALLEANVLAKGAQTLAYSYVGPELTRAIYRDGTIGKAKEHLEEVAHTLDKKLQTACQGHAYVSVNKGLVTQASAAIPIVPLYFSLMFKVMKEKGLHEGCIEQIWRLFADKLYSGKPLELDNHRRIRIDEKEMRDDVQTEVKKLWSDVTTKNLKTISDLKGYQDDFYKLFGFNLDGIDYSQEVDPLVDVPSLS